MSGSPSAKLRSFHVTVDYNQTIEQMIGGHYASKHKDINSRNFPLTGTGTVATEVVLVHFNRLITTDNARREMATMGLQPARIEHCVAFGANYPQIQRNHEIVFLGSTCVQTVGREAGSLSVPYFHWGPVFEMMPNGRINRAGEGNRLDLFPCTGPADWGPEWRFAAIREESLRSAQPAAAAGSAPQCGTTPQAAELSRSQGEEKLPEVVTEQPAPFASSPSATSGTAASPAPAQNAAQSTEQPAVHAAPAPETYKPNPEHYAAVLKILETVVKPGPSEPGGAAGIVLANSMRWSKGLPSCLDLRGAKLDRFLFLGAVLDGAQLQQASLEGTQWVIASIVGTDFSGANLRHAKGETVSARGCKFRQADLSHANLDLRFAPTGLDFAGAKLHQTTLDLVDAAADATATPPVDFSNADLTGATLKLKVHKVPIFNGACMQNCTVVDSENLGITASLSPEQRAQLASGSKPVESSPVQIIAGLFSCVVLLGLVALAGWGLWWAGAQVMNFFAEDSERRFEGLAVVDCLAFSPDGKRLAGNGDRDLRVWDVATGFVVRKHEWPSIINARRMTFAADGGTVFMARDLGGGRSFNLTTGEGKDEFHIEALSHLRPRAPNGSMEAELAGKTIKLLRTDRSLVHELKTAGDARIVTFSPDSKKLLSFSTEGTIRLWNLDSGAQERECRAAGVERLIFLPDGKRFISTDGPYARLWRVDADSSVLRMGHYARDIRAVALSPDGRYLATGTTSGAVRLWKLPE